MPYPLPETVHPPEYVCLKITIPNEETYRRNIIGHLHQMTRWFNHERDDDHTAKQVGEEWMKAFVTIEIGDCDDMTCCPEDQEVNYAEYRQGQIDYQKLLKMMDDGDTAASFNAPPTFNGDGSPTRNYALCRTINRLVQSTFNDAAMAVGAASDVITSINRVFPSLQPISGIVSIGAHVIGDIHLKQLAKDCSAIRAVSCCMRDALEGQDTTIENLQGALGGCGFDFGTHEAEIAGMVNNMLGNRDNARAFIASMDDDFQNATGAAGASAADCECECCEDEAIIVDFRHKGNVLTYMGNCIWRSVQPTPVFEPPALDIPRWYHSVGDSLGRCIDVQPPPAGSGYYEQHVSDHYVHTCTGIEGGTVGGWGGQVIWGEWRGEQTQYYQIKLVE